MKPNQKMSRKLVLAKLVWHKVPRRIGLPRARRRQTASLLAEMVAAIGLSAVVLATVAQLLGFAAQQRRLARQRSLAVQEAANRMEATAALSWEELPTSAGEKQPASAWLLRQVPSAQVSVRLVETAPQAAKRIEVAVEWTAAAQRPSERVSLVSWRYPEVAASAPTETGTAMPRAAPPLLTSSRVPPEERGR